MWNPSLALRFVWPERIGYHMNVDRSSIPAESEAWEAAGVPLSPETVWAGDPGIPQERHPVDEDGNLGSPEANPDWSPSSPAFDTVFLIFVDEADARECLPHLWIEEAAQ